MQNSIKTKLFKIKRNLSNLNYYKFQLRRLFQGNVINTRYKKNVSSMFNYSSAIFSWFQDNGSSLLYEHNLNSKSIVVEVGAYTGTWSLNMYNKYNCTVLAYEPVKKYYNQLNENISQFEKVKSYNFGLCNKNEKVKITHKGVQTSILNQFEDFDEIIEIRDIASLKHLKNLTIDLISINIEGSEYDLLNRIIETQMINNITSIQVQFHEWYPSLKESKILRNQIHNKLKETHRLVYSYDFIWEKWSKK